MPPCTSLAWTSPKPSGRTRAAAERLVHEAFDLFDTDGSGEIDSKELKVGQWVAGWEGDRISWIPRVLHTLYRVHMDTPGVQVFGMGLGWFGPISTSSHQEVGTGMDQSMGYTKSPIPAPSCRGHLAGFAPAHHDQGPDTDRSTGLVTAMSDVLRLGRSPCVPWVSSPRRRSTSGMSWIETSVLRC